jgi:hypothetical protein
VWGPWSPFRLTTAGRPSALPAIVVLAVYVAATLYVGLHHEPWRDEADAWLVARDAPLRTLLDWTRNAGTPSLWYLLLKPPARLGLPYQSMQIIHLILAWAAAAFLLFRAPLTWVTKILLLASYYFAFEYAVIARSYVLTILLLWLIAEWYPRRYERPIAFAVMIALLFNANAHGAIIAALVALLFTLSVGVRRVPRLAVLVMLAGAIVFWAQIRAAPDTAFPDLVRHIHPWTPMQAVDTAFFPGPWLRGTASAALLLLVTVAVALRRHIEALLLLLLSTLAFCALFVFVWYGGHRHAGLILVTAVAAIWIAREVAHDGISVSAALLLNLTLALSVGFAAQTAVADVRFAFSASREMGEFIRQNGLDRLPIAAHNMQQCEAVLPWIPGKRLWYPAVSRSGTYMLWNRDESIGIRMRHAEAVDRAVRDLAPRQTRWLMLLNTPMPEEIGGFRLLYATRQPVFRYGDERYWLYEWSGAREPRDPRDTRRSSRRSSSGSAPSTPPDTRHSPLPRAAGRS